MKYQNCVLTADSKSIMSRHYKTSPVQSHQMYLILSGNAYKQVP